MFCGFCTAKLLSFSGEFLLKYERLLLGDTYNLDGVIILSSFFKLANFELFTGGKSSISSLLELDS